jgi:hypothetical protein
MAGCLVAATLVCVHLDWQHQLKKNMDLMASLSAAANRRVPKRLLSTSKSKGMDDNASPLAKNRSTRADHALANDGARVS